MLGSKLTQKWKASHEFSAGMKKLENGNYEEALPHLEKSFELNHGDHYTALNLSINYLSVGRFEDALARIEAAIALSPKNPVSFLYKAFICMKMEKYEEADASLEECLRYDPKNPHCNYLKGLLMIRKKAYSESCRYFEKYVLFNKPEIFARLLLASELYLAEKTAECQAGTEKNIPGMNDDELKSILEDFYKGKDQIASEKVYNRVETRKFDHILARLLLASEIFFKENNIDF